MGCAKLKYYPEEYDTLELVKSAYRVESVVQGFMSVDPLKDEYPIYTSYQYAGNKPITFIDLDGLEETLPPILQPTDNTNALIINQQLNIKVESLLLKERKKKILKENAIEIIRSITANNSQESRNEVKEGSTTKPLEDKATGFVKGKLKGGLETTIDLELKSQNDELRKSGTLTTNKGRNLQTKRFKTVGDVKQPVNFGFINKAGEVETTKGIIPTNSKIKNLNRIKGGLKLFNFLKEGPLEEVFAAVDLAKVFAGLAEPESILPLAFVTEDQFKNIDVDLLEKSIEQGLTATENFIQKSDFEFVFTNEEDAIKLLAGEVKSLEELDGFKNDYTIFDKSNQFGLLISRTRENITVNAIFFNKNGFD